ncbi:MAG: hypothetical protein IT567_07420 [Alphaproteobacteria bacterium]|nr:hypothetical protein [Alphaproteobacteria bacterium]
MIRSRYQFNNSSSPIERIEVHISEAEGRFARIHFRPNADPAALDALRLKMRASGFFSSPNVDETTGEAFLRVDGFNVFRGEKALLKGLDKAGISTQNISRETPKLEPDPEESKGNLFQRGWKFVQRQALRFDGLFGLIGHMFLFAAGTKTGDNGRRNAATFYGASTLLLIIFGNGAKSIDDEDIVEKTRKESQKAGINLQPDAYDEFSRETLLKRNAFQKAGDVFLRYPFAFAYGLGVPGNVAHLSSALKDKNYDRMAVPALGMFGTIVTMLLPEKALADQDLPKNPGIGQRITSEIQARPLRFHGTIMLLDNAFLWKEAFNLDKVSAERVKTHPPRIAEIEKLMLQLLGNIPKEEFIRLCVDEKGAFRYNAETAEAVYEGLRGVDLRAGNVAEQLMKQFPKGHEEELLLSKIINLPANVWKSVETTTEAIKERASLIQEEGLKEGNAKYNEAHAKTPERIAADDNLSLFDKLQKLSTARNALQGELDVALRNGTVEDSKNPLDRVSGGTLTKLMATFWTLSSLSTFIASKNRAPEQEQLKSFDSTAGRLAYMMLSMSPEERTEKMDTVLAIASQQGDAAGKIPADKLKSMVETKIAIMEQSPLIMARFGGIRTPATREEVAPQTEKSFQQQVGERKVTSHQEKAGGAPAESWQQAHEQGAQIAQPVLAGI